MAWMDVAKVKMSIKVAKDIGHRAKPFLLTMTSFLSAS